MCAGLITSATAEALSPAGNHRVCDTGVIAGGTAACSSIAGDYVAAYSRGTAAYGTVSAFIAGGALGPGNNSSATAAAAFTDTLTFFGGTGTGVVSIVESILNAGSGALDFGNLDPPRNVRITQTFTFGTPFELTLSAIAGAGFLGGYSDQGTLLVQKNIESLTVSAKDFNAITYSDASGHAYNTLGTAGFTAARQSSASGHVTLGTAGLTAAAVPEPGAWVLGAIGSGLLWIARRKAARPAASQQTHHQK